MVIIIITVCDFFHRNVKTSRKMSREASQILNNILYDPRCQALVGQTFPGELHKLTPDNSTHTRTHTLTHKHTLALLHQSDGSLTSV